MQWMKGISLQRDKHQQFKLCNQMLMYADKNGCAVDQFSVNKQLFLDAHQRLKYTTTKYIFFQELGIK